MIDLLRIAIPFKEQFVSCGVDSLDRPVGLIDLNECALRGCKLEAGEVKYLGVGEYEVGRLRHPYESLPSSNSTLSFKIFKGGDNYWPHIEIKASPAKLLQAHNVYGSDNVKLCVETLVIAFTHALPSICDMLDFYFSELKQIDCTYMARVETEMQSRAVIQALKNLSSGQTRASRSAHETTVYWGTTSRNGKKSSHKQLKAYLKMAEVLAQITELQKVVETTEEGSWQRVQLAALQDADLQDFARNTIRFEASVMPNFLKRLGFPTRMGDFVHHCESMKNKRCPVQWLWFESWKDIFKTFEGKDVNIYNDDEVRDLLRAEFLAYTPNGKITYAKADRLFRFIRALKNEGWDEVKHTTSESTFYRNIQTISSVIPKSFLINLQTSAASNVVPLVRLINVDFNNQLPLGWVEPQSLAKQTRLRAVS